jgi:Ca2+-binding RTX toxin-like protein
MLLVLADAPTPIQAASARTCLGQVATITGTDGDDTLRGTAGDDVIWLGAGDDSVNALEGNDLVCAGRGTDFITLGEGDDQARGGALTTGNEGNDVLWATAPHQHLDGGRGNDRLVGSRWTDMFSPGLGNDVVVGGGGTFDMLTFQDIRQPVTINVATGHANGQGWDTFDSIEAIVGSNLADVYHGGPGDDWFGGAGGFDTADGGPGDDELSGDENRDLLRGGRGDDVLGGGSDADRANGGPGHDECYSEVRIDCE